MGEKKSNFTALTSVADASTFDFVSNGQNFKITKADLLAALGVTGTLSQEGAVTGTPVLDITGAPDFLIRNLEDGSGVKSSLSPENGITLNHNFTFDAAGVPLTADASVTSPVIRSLVAGSGIAVAAVGDTAVVTATALVSGATTLIINSESDFPTQTGTTITLETGFAYRIATPFSTAKRFICEPNSAMVGPSLNIPSLTYTGTDPMFTTTSRFYMFQLNFSCASSDMLDHNGPGFVVMSSCVCSSCDSPGDVSSGLLTLTHTSIFGITTSGLTWSGTGNSFIMFDSIITTANTMTLIDFGSATFTDISINDCSVTGPVGSTAVSGLVSSGNMEANRIGVITNSFIGGDGTPLNNISNDDDSWQFLLNDNIGDTHPDGLLSMQGNATNTTIGSAGVGVLAAGTWVVEFDSQGTGTTAGRFTYSGIRPVHLPLTAAVTIEPVSGGSQVMGAMIAINGVAVANSLRTGTASPGSPTSITIPWQAIFSSTDYAEVFVTNEDTANHVLVSSATFRIN
jgi:hypothetical protein